jgi:hypothetical protein
MKLSSSSALLLLYLTCLLTKATGSLALTREEREQELSTRKNAPQPRIRGRALKRGDDPKGESKQQQDQQQETPQETNRVYVRYNNEAGHMHALTRAKEIIQDKDDDDVIILSCEDDCLARFQGDSSIIEADYDYQVAAFGNHANGPVRTLEELIPWGLTAIQADTMEVGDDDILICIVDTGIAIGHPDFNSDFISGTDTYKGRGEVWEWNDDRSTLRSAEIWNRLWSLWDTT